MEIIPVLVALVAAIQAAQSLLPPIEIRVLFASFKIEFNKTYACPELEDLRFKIFKHNVRDIEEHNRGNYSWFKFTDMLPCELNKGLLVNHSKPLAPIKWQFEDFKKTYNRKYACPELEDLRFKIFAHTVHMIEEHNKLYDEGKSTWEMGINKFADMLVEEILPDTDFEHDPVPLSYNGDKPLSMSS